ncbi:MAG: MFS transporter [Mangrovicoccus sp.]
MLKLLSLSRHSLPAFAVAGLFGGAFHAYAPETKLAAGASDAGFGLALLMAAAGALFAMRFAVVFEARFGNWAVAIAAIFSGFAFQAVGLAGSLPALCVATFATGSGLGLMDVVMNSRLSAVEARSKTPLMGLNHGFFSLIYTMSALASGPLREFGVPLSLYGGGLGLLALLCAAASIERGQKPPPGPAPGLRMRFSRLALLGGLIIGIGFLGENGMESWSALHLERSLGGSAIHGALGPVFFGLTMAVGRFASQALVIRLGAARLLYGAGLLASCGAGLAAMAASPSMAYLGFACAGLGISVIAPMAYVIIGRQVSDAERSQAIAQASILGYGGFFLGPPVTGLLAQFFGLPVAFAAVALALIAILPITLSLDRRSM